MGAQGLDGRPQTTRVRPLRCLPRGARTLTPRGCASVDSLAGLQGLLAQLRQKLARDPDYFTHVYNYTFEFSRPPGQRSLGARAGVVARGATAD